MLDAGRINEWNSVNSPYDRPMTSSWLEDQAKRNVIALEKMKDQCHPRLRDFCGEGISFVDKKLNCEAIYHCSTGMLLGLLDKIDELETKVFNYEHKAEEDTYDGQ